MQLKINLEQKENTERVNEVLKKEQERKYQPTWDEIWYTGYTKPSGAKKDGIFKTKMTDSDREKLNKVKEAIEKGVIGTNVEDMQKFTKTHALKLYKVLQDTLRDKTIDLIIQEKPENYHLINTEEQLKWVIEMLNNESYIGLDTETTGLEVFGKDRIVGTSLSFPRADQHVYIPVRHNTQLKQLDPEVVFTALKPFLESEKLGKVLHNAKFDAHMFRKEGVNLNNVIMDTMVSFHVLNENEPSYALKKLATKWGKHFGFEDKSQTYEELFGKVGFQDIPLDIGMIYACKDTHLVVKFYEWIMSNLEKQPKLLNVHLLETEVLKVTIEMEKNGFCIDDEFVKSYLKELTTTMNQLESELKDYFGDINLNSPEQLKNKLFTEMGLPDKNNGSVDAHTLKSLQNEHEGIKKLLEYRETAKLFSTYIEPLPRKVSPIDNRLHGQFKQTGTVTGRFSSSDPNLQNIPPLARKMFIAPDGKLLLGMDFSKVEPTILADMSGDEKFKKPFLEGVDIYSTLASETFHKPIEQCGDGTKERKMMKTGLLATMYGTSMFTLSEQLGISVEEADEFIHSFLSNYPVVASWIDSVHKTVDEQGYVETMFGRKRRFIGHPKIAKQFKITENKIEKKLGRKPVNIWKENLPYALKQEYWEISQAYFRASRQSVNAIIQGTGAEIMKKALVNIYYLFKQWGDEYKVLATIHDEVLLEVPEDITREQIDEIESRMITCVKLSIPLRVDTEIMRRWGEGIPKNEWFNGKEV